MVLCFAVDIGRFLGVRVVAGVGEAIADDSVNMWSVMKTAAMLHTLGTTDYDLWPQAHEVLKAATQSGGLAMREPGLGTLNPGAPADLILINLQVLPFVPLNHLPRQLFHCELGQSVMLTMVAGRIVVSKGEFKDIESRAIMQEATAVFAAKITAMDKAD